MESTTTQRAARLGFFRRYWLTLFFVGLAVVCMFLEGAMRMAFGMRAVVLSLQSGHITMRWEQAETEGKMVEVEYHGFHWVSPSMGDLPSLLTSDTVFDLIIPIWMIFVLAADWIVLREYFRIRPSTRQQMSVWTQPDPPPPPTRPSGGGEA